MSTRTAAVALIVLGSYSTTPVPGASDSPPRLPSHSETLQRPDGQQVSGKLLGDAASGYRFAGRVGNETIPVEVGSTLVFDGPGPPATAGLPAFRIDLGLDRRISGKLGLVDDLGVEFVESSAGGPIRVARAGARALDQRLGEIQVLDDSFETLNPAHWTLTGDPEVVDHPHIAAGHSVRIPAGNTSLTARLPEPVAAGRLEVAFHDAGETSAGQQWFVDLLFRGPSGSEAIRAILGWAEESLSVESPDGPALAVQRLSRKPGWHRLSVRFGLDATEISVDGNDLAHGKGPGGPLVEIRLASHNSGEHAPPTRISGHFDDLRLVRFAEPVSGLEVDPSQDEARLSGGDQLFGTLRGADAEVVRMKVDDRDVSLPWSEVAGLDFRRVAEQGQLVEGWIVRVEWRAAPGDDARDLDQAEGALTSLDDSSLTLATPYAGRLRLARDRLKRLRVLGRGRRLVIDSTAHHLGNEIVGSPSPLDPPQPEGGVLERTFDWPDVAPGPAFVTLDVVQVVGEASGLPFSNLVKQGEVRTNLVLNGKAFDYLNRHINSKNETPERIRLPIPDGLLRPGKNRLRIEQVGKASDPNYLDDLGVLEIAVETTGTIAAETGPKKP